MERKNAGALRDFVRQEEAKLKNFVRKRVDSTMDAEDVIQDVMVSILGKADPVLPLENLAAYVYRSLKNRIIDIYRSPRRELSLDASLGEEEFTLKDLLADMSCDTAGDLERKEAIEQLFEAIDSLREEERAVVLATEMDGMTTRELSELWKIPMGTLQSRKARALKKLKKILTPYIMEEQE